MLFVHLQYVLFLYIVENAKITAALDKALKEDDSPQR